MESRGKIAMLTLAFVSLICMESVVSLSITLNKNDQYCFFVDMASNEELRIEYVRLHFG